MEVWINKFLPNVIDKIPEFLKAMKETLYMTTVSMGISFLFGIILGIILIITSKQGIKENRYIYGLLDKLINVIRSIPFVILLASLIPFTRLLLGSAIGPSGAIIPLIFGTVPFFARQVESALSEVDHGIIEAALSMGTSTMGIIFRVYLKESIPAIARVTSITTISLVGLTAMAGAIGGGGLGDFAIRYGHQRNQTDVTYVTIIAILIFVTFIQLIGNRVIKKTSH